MSSVVNPDVLLQELIASATPRTTRSLNLLHQVLKKQSESDKKDFSIATIGRLSSEAGGPSVQTIRNRTGKHFQQLIETWAAYTGTTTKKPLSARQKQMLNSNDQQIMDSIQDPVLRAVVGSLIAERNRYRDQLNTLKANADLFIDKTLVPNPDSGTEPSLTPMELEALEHATSAEFFEDMQWIVMPTGQVKTKAGTEVYKRGYQTGIQRLLSGKADRLSPDRSN